jgi:cyanobactin biosynthesis protein (PatB/AcyB/McaB family)
MPLPNLAPPVRRPQLVEPHRTVDLDPSHYRYDQLRDVKLALVLGANFNDPPGVAFPTYQRMEVSSCTGP